MLKHFFIQEKIGGGEACKPRALLSHIVLNYGLLVPELGHQDFDYLPLKHMAVYPLRQ